MTTPPRYPDHSAASVIHTMLGVIGGLPDRIEDEDAEVQKWLVALRGFGSRDLFNACQIYLETTTYPPGHHDILLLLRKVTGVRLS